MERTITRLDSFAIALTETMIRWRWLVIVLAIAVVVTAASGGRFLAFENNYRVFFSDENPELSAFETFQDTYTKNDNFFFVVRPRDGVVFSNETLAAIDELTEAAWQIPYSRRVDSITNFQHTYAIEDDLIVEDLVSNPRSLSGAELNEKREIALAEPLLRDQLLTQDARATGVNVVIQYPELETSEVSEAVVFARGLRADIETAYPNLDIELTGVSMLNNAFQEGGNGDLATLVPLMFLLIAILSVFALRSFSLALATLGVIFASTAAAMGIAGYIGYPMTPISGSAPIVILTLAVADSIHILFAMRTNMRAGMDKRKALVEAIRLNFLAVAITSLTTAIGFLSLNLSDSPPFWHLGNISAMGIGAAWLFSITLLPALVSLLPVRVKAAPEGASSTGFVQDVMSNFAEFVIANYRKLFVITGAGALTLIAFIPQIELNDQWSKYFDERIEFRRDTDVASQYFGLYPIEYSIPAGEAGGVSNPEFLERLEAFTNFLREQPNVTHVYSLTDIMKRLNKNLNADDPSFYRLPEDRELSAQYLLLYELSLPYGLDLNDRVNIDKSATRVTVTLDDVTTNDTKALLENAEVWMEANFPPEMRAKATSAQVMFTYISDRNVSQMLRGTALAISAIAIIMILALQSVRLGLLSLIPNALPILTAFGAWAVLIGTVGFSIAIVGSISLGIVVDDTVHFLTKFARARRDKRLSTEDSIRYAFRNVGVAILINTVILSLGFLVLTYSSFKVTLDMGLLTAFSIVAALILDFLLLPGILLWMGRKSDAKAKLKGAENDGRLFAPAQ